MKTFWNPVKPSKSKFKLNTRVRNLTGTYPKPIKSIHPQRPKPHISSKPLFSFNPVKKKDLTYPQAKALYPGLNPRGDADKDGVKNWLDCRPFDKKRQDEKSFPKTSPKLRKEIEERIDKLARLKTRETAQEKANIKRERENRVNDIKRVRVLKKELRDKKLKDEEMAQMNGEMDWDIEKARMTDEEYNREMGIDHDKWKKETYAKMNKELRDKNASKIRKQIRNKWNPAAQVRDEMTPYHYLDVKKINEAVEKAQMYADDEKEEPWTIEGEEHISFSPIIRTGISFKRSKNDDTKIIGKFKFDNDKPIIEERTLPLQPIIPITTDPEEIKKFKLKSQDTLKRMAIKGYNENFKKEYKNALYAIDRPTINSINSVKKGIRKTAENQVLNEESIRAIRQEESFPKDFLEKKERRFSAINNDDDLGVGDGEGRVEQIEPVKKSFVSEALDSAEAMPEIKESMEKSVDELNDMEMQSATNDIPGLYEASKEGNFKEKYGVKESKNNENYDTDIL